MSENSALIELGLLTCKRHNGTDSLSLPDQTSPSNPKIEQPGRLHQEVGGKAITKSHAYDIKGVRLYS